MERFSSLGGKPKELARGAEAVIWLDGQTIVKERVSKGYRLPVLDQRLRKQRTRSQASVLGQSARAGANVPAVKATGEFTIEMEFIQGKRLKESLDSMENREPVCREIGKAAAALHSSDIVHGDLTTSNMLWHSGKLFLVDFGLAKHSKRAEDKAVDLFLLYEAFTAAHFNFLERGWASFLEGYKWAGAKEVLAQLEKIKKRRRYKKQVG